MLLFVLFEALFIKRRIEGVEVLAVELIGHQSEILAKPLIVNDLARSQEPYRVDNVGIVAEAQDIVIGGTSLLLSKGFVNMTCR